MGLKSGIYSAKGDFGQEFSHTEALRHQECTSDGASVKNPEIHEKRAAENGSFSTAHLLLSSSLCSLWTLW